MAPVKEAPGIVVESGCERCFEYEVIYGTSGVPRFVLTAAVSSRPSVSRTSHSLTPRFLCASVLERRGLEPAEPRPSSFEVHGARPAAFIEHSLRH